MPPFPRPAPPRSFNSVINALGMAGLWEEALSVMEDMVMDGVAPNSVTYASAINACGNSRQLERALGLLKEARLAGIEVVYAEWDFVFLGGVFFVDVCSERECDP